ncbi:MAG: methylaspartate mutase subunit E [Candidatus Rokubacteria bacterium]|nr:methylaspartate mutase subunit E [Candidatus Rokubacteria bacterium]
MSPRAVGGPPSNVRNARWTDEEFQAVRAQVLAMWPTGREVDLDEAVGFHRSLKPGQNHARRLAEARRTGRTLIQPLAGVATVGGQIALTRCLQDEGGADVVPTQVDSLTRTLRFAEAETKITESEHAGRSLLNGFPIVNHGVAKARRVVEQLRVPVELRAGAPDLRLVAEMAFASGHSGFTVGPIYYTFHYSSGVELADSIRYWQYLFRLAGIYQERGVPISLNVHGAHNSAHFPHSLLNAAVVLETLLAAEQGVRNVHIDTRCMGNLVQDVAAARIAAGVVTDYCRRSGYPDVSVYTVNKTWSGAFPQDEPKAYALLAFNSTIGALAGADELIIKSVEEAVGVPAKEKNAASIRSVRHTVDMVKAQRVPLDERALAREAEMVEAETRAVVDRVLEVGGGDPAVGIVRAVKAGYLDVPFAASRHCAGKVLVVRDADGAVRFLDPGDLPIPKDVLAYHREKIAEREAVLGRPVGYQEVVEDVLFLSTGVLAGSAARAART